MRAVFSIFSRIGPVLFRKSRFPSQEEIATLEELCNRFGEVFLVFFPDLNITRKMHELIFYVPKFASRFKTIGLMTEEVGESLHASVNRELRNLFSLRYRTKSHLHDYTSNTSLFNINKTT